MRVSLRGLFVALAMALFQATPVWAQTAEPSPVSPPAAEAVMPSVRSLFGDLVSDVRRLPTVSNGIWVGGSGALALAVHGQDRMLTRRASGSHGLETALDAGELLGSGLVQASGAFGTYVVGRITHRPAIAIVGADLVRAQMIDAGLIQGLKYAVGRTRPDGGRYSFPSGHSAASFTTATVLEQHFGWKAGVPAYAAAAYVAASRLSENRHYLSDVVFGAGIGILSGRAVTVGRGSHAFVVSPTARAGAVGVSFTRVVAE
ncbi:MAG: phosphatase PAP2 family protein [Acidobacteriota bacterium]